MVKTIVVCGAGTMGSGIAQVSAQAGFKTVLFDVNAKMLAKSKKAITTNLQSQLQKGRVSADQIQAALSALSFTADINDCIADVIIEAIIEKLEAKASLFNQLTAINSNQTIFATNTSSLSISQIALTVTEPLRVVGMHFFNPAPLMKLVEVVRGEQTSTEVIQTVCDVAKQMNKTPVICNDSPGFIVNRVARHYYLEVLKLVESGVTDIETADKLMEATGFKMGPFKLMDLIGMDINYSVSNIVWEALGKPERLKPSAAQKEKVDAGALGKKTGKGFYDYSV